MGWLSTVVPAAFLAAAWGISPIYTRIPAAAARGISPVNPGIPAATTQPPEIDNPPLDLGFSFMSNDGSDTSFQSNANRTLHTPRPDSPKGH